MNLDDLNKLVYSTITSEKRLRRQNPIIQIRMVHIILCLSKALSITEKTKRIINTFPISSSASTHPADHMSMAVVYSVAPKISSGAL